MCPGEGPGDYGKSYANWYEVEQAAGTMASWFTKTERMLIRPRSSLVGGRGIGRYEMGELVC